MITSKLAPWFALAVTLLVPLTGLAQNKPRIVFITHGQTGDPFWDVGCKGAETEEENRPAGQTKHRLRHDLLL